MSRRSQNYDYAGMANANFSDNMQRRSAPTFEGVAHGYAPQKPDYNGENMVPPQQLRQPMYAPPPQQQYQQPMYAPPQYQQPMYAPPPQQYQQRYDGYTTQGYQPEEQMRRPPKNNDKDVGNSYEVPMNKKSKNNGGYYDFSSNGSFTMKG